MPKRYTAGEIESYLKKGGFTIVSQKGSHRKWRNSETGKQVIVPWHQGKTLPVGTMMSIVNGSGLGKEFFDI
ncbi:MAG TPA: type II toxin-antitoxin system HicA family toxin [Spirochaetota bacterium]|nr:type II toxin-antitoxin system HicA family toxin [Spirochaetota bacterium]HQP50074.1 type II toxin-antitoxin system HicA family toxin [Spirochaetota bacterium]